MPGIYIHIPFCVKKCRYCDFISFDNRCEYTDAYIDALISEMREYNQKTEIDDAKRILEMLKNYWREMAKNQ